MCQILLIIYPCNHTILASSTSCAAGRQPRNCDPRNNTVTVKHYHEAPLGLPEICPGCKDRGPCFNLPIHPMAFGELCQRYQIGFEDAIAIVPAWIFDLHGSKVGTRSSPWRVLDYIVAWYRMKSPIALRRQLNAGAPVNGPAGRKRKIEDDASVKKKLKNESTTFQGLSVIEGIAGGEPTCLEDKAIGLL